MSGWDMFGKVVEGGYDRAGDVIDWGKEKLGEGIDKGSEIAGDVIERAGSAKLADAIRDVGDRTASSLGAEIAELQLGETEEADELIHGNPAKINKAVTDLLDFQTAFDLVGQGMKKLDTGEWKGEAADAFREKFALLPPDWLHAADACEAAA
ncbi:putative T7SS-secreted protein, partial [Streptomyces sp. NPDC003036]|uniref:putative T7SS-secreted protein n=1 Tax=Streptomyces sp. NPDC003036 TaxID=3154442 RepID=UPI0033BA985B